VVNAQAKADDVPDDVLVVTGPTASGKSALALGLAERLAGTIINMDAMQCYRDLRILTARPTVEEEARVPHALYGVRDAAEAVTAGWWRGAALAAIAAARAAGRLPILCGGTGLYLRTLIEGIADLPPIPPAARTEARAMVAAGSAAAHAWLAARDPVTATRLRPSDPQRIARAIEIWLATGESLDAWQTQKTLPPAPLRLSAIIVDPPPSDLRAAIEARFGAMLRSGALDEVRALVARGLDASLPIMRAHGVPELAAHLRGEMSLEAAAERAILLTGQYTKRQRTWWRHHAAAPQERTHNIHARIAFLEQFPECESVKIFAFLDKCGLTAVQHHP
jgi:tRNA dimethylallyltransferase